MGGPGRGGGGGLAGSTTGVDDETGAVTCVPRLRGGKRGAYGTVMDEIPGDGLAWVLLSFSRFKAATASATEREDVSGGVSFGSVVSLPPSESDTDWNDEAELT